VIRPGGHFIFTAEAAPEGSLPAGRGYRLMRTGRFGYSKEYIDSLVAGADSPYKVIM
jgi:predicted TPR repeat methyltransferase